MREKEATDSSSHGRLLLLKVEETALRTQGAEMERVVFNLFGGNSKWNAGMRETAWDFSRAYPGGSSLQK